MLFHALSEVFNTHAVHYRRLQGFDTVPANFVANERFKWRGKIAFEQELVGHVSAVIIEPGPAAAFFDI